MTEADMVSLLNSGELTVLGTIPGSSNAAFLVLVEDGKESAKAVYKPASGARELADFTAESLMHAETAAYELSRVLGLGCIPPTVTVEGPLGPGSLQAYVESTGHRPVDVFAAEAPQTWLPIVAAEAEDGAPLIVAHENSPGLRMLALFDVLIGNADRKGGHVIEGHYLLDGRTPTILGIDNGLSFHPEPKLRTVLWGFSGEHFTRQEQEIVHSTVRLAESASVLSRLSPDSRSALRDRAVELASLDAFPPVPDDRHPLPWPLI